jgi:hypothetical protein
MGKRGGDLRLDRHEHRPAVRVALLAVLASAAPAGKATKSAAANGSSASVELVVGGS